MTLTPVMLWSFDATEFVSVVEPTESNVMALVFLSAFSSIVNLDIEPSSIKFLILLLIADSDKPNSFPISTKDFLESYTEDLKDPLIKFIIL